MNTVSVVIPVFNRAGMVCRAIDSVLSQSIKPGEIIVIDDGSTDDTADILARYGTSIIVLRQANRGVSAARNAGIKASHGDFIAFLDSDDEWLPGKLERQLSLMDHYTSVGMIGTGVRSIAVSDNSVLTIGGRERYGNVLEQLLFDDFLTTSSLMIRKSCLEGLNGIFFRENFSWAEDWEFKVRFAARFEIYVTAEILVNYYVTTNSLSRQHGVENFRGVLNRFYKVLLEDPVVRPVIDKNVQKLQAAVHFLVGREYYNSGSVWTARQEFLRSLLKYPFTPNLRSLMLMLFFPRGVQKSFRRFKARIESTRIGIK